MPRTHKKNWRVYVAGFDMSSHAMGVGPLAHLAEPAGETALVDALNGFLPGVNTVEVGTLNTILDNTAVTGSQIVLKDSSVQREVSVAIGLTSAPVSGDPCFAGQFQQLNYLGVGDPMVTASVEFGPDASADTLLYAQPWGNIIHAKGAETGANTGEGDHENVDGQTTAGGFMVYHLFTSDGTCTLSIEDDQATDGGYTALVSSGEIDASAAPVSGLVALGTGVTVDTFLRWQLSLNSASTATFFISFHRG